MKLRTILASAGAILGATFIAVAAYSPAQLGINRATNELCIMDTVGVCEALGFTVTAHNNTTLAAISTTSHPFVERDGFSSQYDSPKVGYKAESGTCVANSRVNDGGSCVNANDGGSWYAPFGNTAPASAWGLDATGATDTTTALQYAINYAATKPVTFACGTYKISAALTISNAGTRLIGQESSDYPCVSIISTSTTADGLTISTDNYYIGWMTVDRTAVPVSGYGVDVQDGHYGRLHYVTAKNNYKNFRLGATAKSFCDFCRAESGYSDGFYFTATVAYPAMQWEMLAPLSQNNNGWGYQHWVTGANGATAPAYINPGSYANNSGGYLFSGDSGSNIADLQMVSPYSSTDGGNGFQWENIGVNNVITGLFAELEGAGATGRGGATAASHVGSGVLVETGGVSALSLLSISGCTMQNNSIEGIAVADNAGLKDLIVSDCKIYDQGAASAGTYAGVDIQSGRARLSNVISENQFTTNQAYGFTAPTTAQAAQVTAVNSTFGGSTGGCNTPPLGSANQGSNCSGAILWTPTAGGQTLAVTANTQVLNILTHVNSVTTGTVTLPTAPPDGTIIDFGVTSNATLTINAGSGDSSLCGSGGVALTTAKGISCVFRAGIGATSPNGYWLTKN